MCVFPCVCGGTFVLKCAHRANLSKNCVSNLSGRPLFNAWHVKKMKRSEHVYPQQLNLICYALKRGRPKELLKYLGARGKRVQ